MTRYRVKSITFTKLKGLNNVQIEFGDYLTAIMGVNGIGKTTVIHALACIFQPEELKEKTDYRFPHFFVPNTDALWSGSEFRVTIQDLNASDSGVKVINKRFGKSTDRWTPPYNTRLKRNVYYLGITSCVPEIERIKTTTRIDYKTKNLDDDNSHKIVQYASYILNKDYQSLLSNTTYSRKMKGVETTTGLKYSSLSMGTGEQRVLTIIETALNAEKYSLILIDEIDLLLHVSAVRKLIKVLNEISKKKNLQIVFTTHSLEMLSLTDYAKIQYLIQNHIDNRMYVLDKITDGLIYDLTEESKERYKFYVEDALAESILIPILKKHKIRRNSKIVKYGAAINAFTLAASNILMQEESSDICVILDGDKYSKVDEKIERIKKLLTGNEEYSEERRNKALSLITQFNLPEGYAPEPFLHSLILDYFDHSSEYYQLAFRLRNNIDSHSFIQDMCEELQCDNKDIVQEILNQANNNEQLMEKWNKYTHIIDEWITSHITE